MIAPTAACRKRRFANQSGTDAAHGLVRAQSRNTDADFPAHGKVARLGCRPVSRRKLCSIKTLAGMRFVTGSLARITIPPHFGQSPAALTWEKKILRWSGSFGFGFLSPQPPGIVGTGPNAESYTLGQRQLVLFVFVGLALRVIRNARQRMLRRGNHTPQNLRSPREIFGLRPTAHPGITTAIFRRNQCSSVYAAPSIGPGRSRLPSWT